LKEMFFHMGIPKTGSSALQVFLAKNRQALLGKNVDYLPIGEIALGVAGKVSSGNGAFLSRCVLPVGAPARIVNGERYILALFDAIRNSTADYGIISSELFVYADKQALASIIAELRSLGVVPRSFYFIRSQVQSLASIYMQQVKRHGCTEQPADYVRREYKHVRFLRHHSFYLKQLELFGQSGVICRIYEAAIAAQMGLFHAFLNALSIGADGLDFGVGDVNTSISSRDLSIMLLLNRFQPRMRFSDAVIENAAQFGTAASGQVHNFLPHDLVEEIERFFGVENANMAKEYFHCSELFADFPLVREHQSVSVNDLSTSDLIAFFGGLLVRYDDRLAALEARLAKQNVVPPTPNAAVVTPKPT
jgi:hypothetical protein